MADDDPIFGRSVVGRDALSKISEGSNEAGSVTSSHYFSVTSSALASRATPVGGAGASRDFLTTVGALRLSPQPEEQPETQRPASGTSSSSVTSVPGGSSSNQDAETLRKTVKAFVEAGVRGRRLEVLRRDGQPQVVTFKLSRKVDSFEIETQAGRPSHTIGLNEVAAVFVGADKQLQVDLAASLPGLDENCAVVDLVDGRCLAFRFPHNGHGSREADIFASCMQIFANEVSRERGQNSSAGGSSAHTAESPR